MNKVIKRTVEVINKNFDTLDGMDKDSFIDFVGGGSVAIRELEEMEVEYTDTIYYIDKIMDDVLTEGYADSSDYQNALNHLKDFLNNYTFVLGGKVHYAPFEQVAVDFIENKIIKKEL